MRLHGMEKFTILYMSFLLFTVNSPSLPTTDFSF